MSMWAALRRPCAVTGDLRLDEIVAVGRADEPVHSVADVLHAIQASSLWRASSYHHQSAQSETLARRSQTHPCRSVYDALVANTPQSLRASELFLRHGRCMGGNQLSYVFSGS